MSLAEKTVMKSCVRLAEKKMSLSDEELAEKKMSLTEVTATHAEERPKSPLDLIVAIALEANSAELKKINDSSASHATKEEFDKLTTKVKANREALRCLAEIVKK
ncbi:hypothetical protein L6452_37160 [Arctium lappa]|uniref:Uncharacterized protein n=1 Tax=Arctium lappa TaxID=4217 RepID=A0ACB8Y2Q6_ARCLA|nr:hypothetical protein L6452_37160 [Arctium lappa]